MAITLTREELFDRIWSEPVLRVSKALGLSGVGLAKLCRRQGIPVPPRGYWAKKDAGRAAPRPDLPRLTLSTTQEIEFPGPSDGASASLPDPMAAPPHPLVAAEFSAANLIGAPSEGLRVTHPLLRSTLEYWKAIKRPIQTWSTPFPRHFILPVSESMQRRTLRLLQTLFAALEKREHSIEIGNRGQIRVSILGEDCNLRVRERQKQVRALRRLSGDLTKYPNKRPHDLIFTGDLELRIDGRFGSNVAVSDNKSRHVEEQLNAVVIALIQAALAEKEYRAAQERRRLAEVERAEAAERLLRLEREARARIKRLEGLAEATARHNRLVAFRTRLRSAVGSHDPAGDMGQWLSWIDSYIDAADVLQVFRRSEREITLYHCVSAYDASDIVTNGFENSPAEEDSEDLLEGVVFADVPLTGVYGGTKCVRIVAPAGTVLPYLSFDASKEYRTFKLPADVANRFDRRLDDV